MRILLISTWMKTLFGDEKAVPGHPNVGIAYLVAVLKKNNYEVKVFDQAIANDDEKLLILINSFKPNLIGLNAFSYCYKYVLDLIAKIKNVTMIPIIVGGPHVSAIKGRILENTSIDFAMKGESERSFIIFLQEFQKNKKILSNAPNLIWRNSSGEIIENENVPFIKNLDNIPFPDYSEFEFEKYVYYNTKTIPIITSRGCPYKCNFCSVRLTMGQNFRSRSPGNIISEIEHWYKQGFKNFEINDDCFNLNLNRAEKICDFILKKGLNITYQLYNGMRADRVTKELLLKMKLSGCNFVSYGAESGNQHVIDAMGKRITLKQIEEAVRLTNEAGIRNSVNFIIGHRGENYEKAKETLRFAENIQSDFVNFYNLIPYPGTEIYDWIDKERKWIYFPDYVVENIGARDLKPVFETLDFSEAERIDILRKGFFFYEKTILKFRFGKIIGSLIYFLSRNRMVFKWGIKIALGTKIGFWFYSLVTHRYKKK